MWVDKTSNNKRSSNYFVVLALAAVLVLAPTAIALIYYNPSLAVAQSSSGNQSKQSSPAANTTGVGKIGSVKQLSKVLGNNSKVISNNTKIGTGKTFQAFGKERKVTAPTPKSIKALPLHPQSLKAGNLTNSSNSGSSSSGMNKTSSNNTSNESSTNSTKK